MLHGKGEGRRMLAGRIKFIHVYGCLTNSRHTNFQWAEVLTTL